MVARGVNPGFVAAAIGRNSLHGFSLFNNAPFHLIAAVVLESQFPKRPFALQHDIRVDEYESHPSVAIP